MERKYAVEQAVRVLPRGIRDRLRQEEDWDTGRWEEVRLRAGRGLFVTDDTGFERPVRLGEKEIFPVTGEDLRQTLELATRSSLQGLTEKLSGGYLPLAGGHRLGIAGTVVLRNGTIQAYRSLSSLNLRIACPAEGMAQPLLSRLIREGRFQSTLILAPPGSGKTTLLRDLIRLLSREGIRVGLADERGEVAALRSGVPQLDVGALTDVMDGCGKGEGILLLLRSMTPDVLAADEITRPEDTRALIQGANCGAALLATAHGTDPDGLQLREAYVPLLQQRLFRYLVTISRTGSQRQIAVQPMPEWRG